jgi:hypothetical protein
MCHVFRHVDIDYGELLLDRPFKVLLYDVGTDHVVCVKCPCMRIVLSKRLWRIVEDD